MESINLRDKSTPKPPMGLFWASRVVSGSSTVVGSKG